MLQTRHPDRVTRLFASDGALQGFASPVARKDYASMREYFLYFLQFEPQIKFEERHVDAGCNYLIDAGSYTWTLKPKDGSEAETVPARYRMVYEYDDGSWRIVEFIEEVTGVASDVSSFAVPDPQTPRAPVALAPKTPAVAGFLKRSTDTTAASKSRKTEKSLDPQPAAVPPFPDSYR